MLMASAELVIILALLTIARETRGKSWCKNEGVGRMRSLLGDPSHANVTTIDPASAERAAQKREASLILADHCRRCGKCSFGKVFALTG